MDRCRRWCCASPAPTSARRAKPDEVRGFGLGCLGSVQALMLRQPGANERQVCALARADEFYVNGRNKDAFTMLC